MITTTSLAPILVTNRKEYIQETIDLYIDKNRKIVILTPEDCGRRIAYIKDKYDNLGNAWLSTHPYIRIIMNLERQPYDNRPVKNKYIRKHQMLYPGLPCSECLEMIPIGSKCVTKKGANYRKSYHCQCAREINII